MNNVELSYAIAEQEGLTERQRLNNLAIYNKQRPEVDKPVCAFVRRDLKHQVYSIDIRKTWSTASHLDKGFAPKGLGISSSCGFIR